MMKEVIALIAFLALVGWARSKYVENLNMDELEPQDPVPFPEPGDSEEGDPTIDCQGFFFNIFGCRDLDD